MFTRWNTGWNDFDDMFSTINQLRHYIDRVFDDPNVSEGAWNSRPSLQLSGSWPRANLADAGSSLAVSAEVPGLTEKDIKLSLNQNVLSISGKRTTEAPQGYSVHRQERPSVEFSRSFTLPCRVDADRASAVVRNGILTVTLEKASDAMPRQITIKAS
jgi:HSP20 family protein